MRKENIGIVLASVLTTLVALAPVAFMAYRSIPPRIATVDLQRLIEEDQKRTLDVLTKSNGAVSEEQRATLQKLTIEFAKKLSASVDQLGVECHCVIVNKAALLGGTAIDYTDIVRERIKR